MPQQFVNHGYVIPYNGNVWRIAEVKEIGEIKFGELIDFIHRDGICMLNFGWLKFGEPWTACQIRQTFPPPNIPAIRYVGTYNVLFSTMKPLLTMIQQLYILSATDSNNARKHT